MAGKISKRHDPSPPDLPDDDSLLAEYRTFMAVVIIFALLQVSGVFS